MTQYLAQKLILPGSSGTPIPLDGPETITERFDTLGSVVSALLPILFSVAGLILFVMLLSGGYQFIFAAGDPGKMSNARKTITNAFIGFFLLFLSWFLAKIIGFIFGINTP